MTQEQKAKAYDEAYKVAESIHRFSSNLAEIKRMEQIFPKLKENEDWITKEIIKYLKEKGDFRSCWIAWLEKQGEQKHFDYENANIQQKDFAPKVEPKFHEGDWVVFNNKHQSIYQVEKIEDGYYILRHTHGGTFRVCVLHDESLRLWTIQDAKDGDVLAYGDNPNDHHVEVIMIFKSLRNEQSVFNHFHIFDDKFRIDDWSDCGKNVHPATKEQRDTLLKAMSDAGWEFDFDKKELKKIYNALEECEIENIEHGKYYYCIKDYYSGGCKRASKGEVVQASRGMSMMSLGVKANEYFMPVNTIKQMSAWSEEDEKMLQGIWDEILANKHNAKECEWKTYDKFLDWLKSLKPQPTWKPSDEQMEALAWALSLAKNCGEECAFDIRTLQDQLKKLKE